MTLIVCLQGNEGIVVAADSRGTFGDPRQTTAQNDTIKKIYLVGNVAILQSGTSNHANMIAEEVTKIYEKGELGGVTDIMNKVREVGYQRFNEWFPSLPSFPVPNGNPLQVRPTIQLLIAGFDVKTPRMYSMVSNYDFAPSLHDYGFVLGGVAQYALYLLNRLYSTDMVLNSLKHLGAYVITETAAQDGKVGGPVQMGVITREKACMLNNEEIQSILNENQNKTNGLKDLFRK